MTAIGFLVGLFFITCQAIQGQATYLHTVPLSSDAVVLLSINSVYHNNSYFFDTKIESDSVFLKIPKGLPRGYFEAYYDGDSNRLAMVYYSNGANSYGQQFYKNGSMKSDSEYNKFGDLHGLHVIYDKAGEELWHAEYYFGVLEPKYNLNFLKEENYTLKAIKNKKIFGTYIFEPTPSRARREKIFLEENHRFSYQNSLNSSHYCKQYAGTWKIDSSFIVLKLDQAAIWSSNPKTYAVVRLPVGLLLLEVKEWGVEWYNSEFIKPNKK